jgi:energy-coupling factor transporter ATP-binding protein EcfA2
MQVVGLTGNIGSGKSTVAKAFVALGIPVFNSDDEAKKAYLIPSIQNEVREILGSPKGPMEGPSEDNYLDFSKDTWKFEIAEIIDALSAAENFCSLESGSTVFPRSEIVGGKIDICPFNNEILNSYPNLSISSFDLTLT